MLNDRLREGTLSQCERSAVRVWHMLLHCQQRGCMPILDVPVAVAEWLSHCASEPKDAGLILAAMAVLLMEGKAKTLVSRDSGAC